MSQPRTSEKLALPTISVGGKQVCVQLEHNNLLESLESADIDVHYHCRDGYCGACRVTLIKGEICYPNGEPLAYTGDNEILPCCCVPKTDISLAINE